MVWFVQKLVIKIRIFAPPNLSGPQDFQMTYEELVSDEETKKEHSLY